MYNGYQPSSDEEYMNDTQLQYFKAKLLSMQMEYLSKHKIGINKNYNQAKWHDIDILHQDNNAHISQSIQFALERIKNKSYGFCEDTGQKIGINRLIANPTATYCLQAQKRRDKEQEIMYRLHGNE